MSFATHSVRENVEAQGRNDAVAVFIVGAHHAHVRGATGRDLQVHSTWGGGRRQFRAHPYGLSKLTLSEAQRARKDVRPTDYSLVGNTMDERNC